MNYDIRFVGSIFLLSVVIMHFVHLADIQIWHHSLFLYIFEKI